MQIPLEAAEQGDAAAENNLGFMYASGLGVVQDDLEAVRWYRMAAKQKYAGAQYNLGVVYDEGLGVTQDKVTQDKVEALRWYRLAAEQGREEANAALKELDAK